MRTGPRFKNQRKKSKKKCVRITQDMAKKLAKSVEDSLDAMFKTKGLRTKWRMY